MFRKNICKSIAFVNMNYASLKKYDIANGPGVRVSLFVSGCRHHCKNCFNQIAWDFNYGKEFNSDTEKEILEALSKDFISGFSLLGGEPFEKENLESVYRITNKIKKEFPLKSIWCYTGFDFINDLLYNKTVNKDLIYKILKNIDILVDGKFIEELKSPVLLFRGSSNQNIIDVKKSLKSNTLIIADGIWERKTGSLDIYE